MMHAAHSIWEQLERLVSQIGAACTRPGGSCLRVRGQLFVQRLALFLAQLLAVRHAHLAMHKALVSAPAVLQRRA